jgi:hypothetical protein
MRQMVEKKTFGLIAAAMVFLALAAQAGAEERTVALDIPGCTA